MQWVNKDICKLAHGNSQSVVEIFRLPLSKIRVGSALGDWASNTSGRSAEFQDHRPYSIGDNPSHIDWMAYARTGTPIIKLFRAEVSPKVDIALDYTKSMFLNESKTKRTLELFYFCLESSLKTSSSIKSWLIGSNEISELKIEQAKTYCLPKPDRSIQNKPPLFNNVPWRTNSLRLIISDLLAPEPPSELISSLCKNHSSTIILSPFSLVEASPDWNGIIEFIDCESTSKKHQLINQPLLEAYKNNYKRHFTIWREFSITNGFRFARIPDTDTFLNALTIEALSLGVIEPWT